AVLPARETLSEREISARIDAATALGDAAQLRRGLIEHGLARRSRDGSAYTRIEQAPPPEALALLDALRARRGAGGDPGAGL
ncbi:DUF2087 domain-containing protein, partial [Litorisediminicola beolgyonensis]